MMDEPIKNQLIMIVEDESVLLQAIAVKLQALGMETVSCASGQQALDYLQEIEACPDALWLDYHLQDMDGIHFMDALRKKERCQNIPVFVVSNSATQSKVHHMMALGATKYLVKANHSLAEIAKTIVEHLSTNRKDSDHG